MNRPVQMWVDSGFKKKLKKDAADKDISVLQLTKKLGQDGHELPKEIESKAKRKNFDFRI